MLPLAPSLTSRFVLEVTGPSMTTLLPTSERSMPMMNNTCSAVSSTCQWSDGGRARRAALMMHASERRQSSRGRPARGWHTSAGFVDEPVIPNLCLHVAPCPLTL